MAYKLCLHDVDFNEFLKTVDKCRGDVFLETEDGDILNLKSRLCQMLGLATLLKGAEIGEAVVRCANPEDETILFRFNLYGEMPEEKQEEK